MSPQLAQLKLHAQALRRRLLEAYSQSIARPLALYSDSLMALSGRMRLPAPVALPVAGAIVGLYAGLLAGIFANLIGIVGVVVLTLSQPFRILERLGTMVDQAQLELATKNWHVEVGLLAALPALAALLLSRRLPAEGAMVTVKRRLKVLSLMTLGALGLYYPLLVLSVLNHAMGGAHEIAEFLGRFSPAWVVLTPALGGFVVGRLLRAHPETHGHGIPQVVRALQREGEGLTAQGGALKILASAMTIGSGGSAGREGPIVYGGAAIATAVARFLGFSRRDLSTLLACGAGAGIAASFNAPVAGAIFALEIILRDFRLKVFSPIILASVTATLVGRSVLGSASMLRRIPYRMASGWEVVLYLALGVVCGLLAWTFIRLLHRTEDFFQGRSTFALSRWLGAQSLSVRAALGGALVGALALVNPVVWGTGHHFSNLAAASRLSVWFLLVACAFKLVGTALTIGSGGSGGTFFPATVIGAMAGGAFGTVAHQLLPSVTAPGGAYALVGMAGVVAGTTGGPLTAMMMIYELTGNYQIILPLMLCCTVASALAHFLIDHAHGRLPEPTDLLSETPVSELFVPLTPIPATCPLSEAVDRILASGETAMPVLDANGKIQGLLQIHELHEIWGERSRMEAIIADDAVHRAQVLTGTQDLQSALRAMDLEDLDVLPVVLDNAVPTRAGVITRAAIRRFLATRIAQEHGTGRHAVAVAELPR